MTRSPFVASRSIRSWIVLLAVGSISLDAAATAQRTFVASYGLTANTAFNCSIAKPCRAFSEAIGVTTSGGEVIVLDSAGYGVVMIAKSVSIIAPPGIYGGVSVFSADGITINGAGINVLLKGLSINGLGGVNGINFVQGASLHVEGCTMTGFSQGGIVINGVGKVTIVDTSLLGNEIGIWAKAAAIVTVARATMDRNHSAGLFITSGASASVVQSTVTNSTGPGIEVRGHASGDTRASIDSSLLADNGDRGVLVYDDGAATVIKADISRSTIVRNGLGIDVLATVGTGRVSATQNVISDNNTYGLVANGAGSKVRATQNTIVRNDTGFQGNPLNTMFSPGTNYVRDNTSSDSFNIAPDTLD
jgi:hypothetical protein